MNLIAYLFKTPTGYEADRTGFLLNQIGHVVLVGLVPALLARVAADLVANDFWSAILLSLPVFFLFLYAVWEMGQRAFEGAEEWDCVEDFGFVACGNLAVTLHPVTALIGAVFLLSGWLRRGA
ncbi:MAG: hypothetical protein L0G27_10065 [Paracoccus sp. (in: a-proteobacteria)]|nr:hypothetical protein [Paracoccus sp. (in: a-proteobacteria)]